ncbi:hypothetical protein [Amycolatopsis cihanbeyliensis]|uniref:Uncharacterized protein n=1 Tax=Amycolatopsis cihanbeyliensis TaxID=1128664 RepID=A0A542DFY2_AMYCI|nr:hypothetical protein [Amycolatopsis cihanbeyliensis]TQJ01970.1 hypothetical protein FB471_1687 [Amycolatopsis cihanbeyliensis]
MEWFDATADPAHALSGDQRRLAAISMDALLDELAHRRWEKWAFGDAADPLGIAFVLWWPAHADVVVLHGPDRAVTYRAHRDPRWHPFTPEAVAWVYAGPPTHAIRTLLLLPPPDALNAPADVLRLGDTVRVPPTWLARRPQLIRPSQ